MKIKIIILAIFLLIGTQMALADVISPIIDDRARYWGEDYGMSWMRINTVPSYSGSYNCNVTIYDSDFTQRYFAYMQMPASADWAVNDLAWGVYHPCTGYNGPCSESAGSYITWTSPDISFYNAYRARYDLENLTYAVRCARLSFPYTVTEQNFTERFYDYMRINVTPTNISWGQDYNLTFSVAQEIGDSTMGKYYNLTLYIYGGPVSIYNYSKVIAVDTWHSRHMEWTNECNTVPCQVTFGLNGSEVNWSNLPNADYMYTVKASLRSIMTDAYQAGNNSVMADHIVTSDDTSWIVLEQETCGNNIIEGAEVCDGTELSGMTCNDFGHSSGTLTCNSTCSGFVTSACYTCGNLIVEGPEVCDGTNISQVCTSGGNISCLASCMGLNTSLCLGKGGVNWPTDTIIPPVAPEVVPAPLAVVPITAGLQLDFSGFWASISLAFETLFVQPLEAVTLMGAVVVDYTLEIILFISLIGLLIFLALRNGKDKKRKR